MPGGNSDDYDFIFSGQVHAAGLWVGSIDTTVVQFLAGDGNVIASEDIDINHAGLIVGQDGNRLFYGITSGVAIKRIRTIEPGGDNDGITLDDVQFGSRLVPEPGALGLLGIGMAGVAMATRVRRRAPGVRV